MRKTGLENHPSQAEPVPQQLMSPRNIYDMISPSFFHHYKSETASLSFHAVGRLKPSILMLSFVDFNVLHPGKKILLEMMGSTRCYGRKISVVINPRAAPQDVPDGHRLFFDLFRRVNVNNLLPFFAVRIGLLQPRHYILVWLGLVAPIFP